MKHKYTDDYKDVDFSDNRLIKSDDLKRILDDDVSRNIFIETCFNATGKKPVIKDTNTLLLNDKRQTIILLNFLKEIYRSFAHNYYPNTLIDELITEKNVHDYMESSFFIKFWNLENN